MSLLVLPPSTPPVARLLLLHGLDMHPQGLLPLVRAARLPAWVALPEGPVDRPGGGRSWWPVDDEARAARLASGPSDLAAADPPGREAARRRVREAAAALQAAGGPDLPLVVAGFSQGAMLALDTLLAPDAEAETSPFSPAALVLWSASRQAFEHWRPRLPRLRGLPVWQRHGRHDANLSLAAGEALRDAMAGAGARVDWAVFEGGHEIPWTAWRALRRQLQSLGEAPADEGGPASR